MPSFNPSVIVEDIDGKPIKYGQSEDPGNRRETTRLRAEIAKAVKDDPNRLPALEEELLDLVNASQRNLTLGEVVVVALRTPLKEDENLSEVMKLDHMEWAMKVRAAQNAGPTTVAEFSNEQIAKIKARVNKCWPSPEVVWRFSQALKEVET